MKEKIIRQVRFERPATLAEEHYVVVDGIEEAKVIIDKVMDAKSRQLFKSRMNHVKANGVVAEQAIPDVEQAIIMQLMINKVQK